MSGVHNHDYDPTCRESNLPGGLTGDCMSPPLQQWEIEILETGDSGVFRNKVREVLQGLENLLVEKNESYGNSALEPINVFSKSDAVEQIKVRIDDKLNRLYHGKEYGDEDTVTDLLGYLVLLKIAEKEIH